MVPKPSRWWRGFRSRPIKAGIYNDLKTHVAFGEDTYQKGALPLVPVEALIPYIYVPANNSFIDFIKKQRVERREEKGRVTEERERETRSVHCLFTPTFLRPIAFLASLSLFFPLCIEDSVWVSSRFKRTGPTQSLPELRGGWNKKWRFKVGSINPAYFPPTPPPAFSYGKRQWYIPWRGDGGL